MQNIQWYIFWIRSCQINLHPRKIHCFSREVLSLFWMKGRVTKNHWSNEGWCISSFSSVQLLSSVQLFATLWTVAYQAPLSMGFSRQEYWSGLPCPSPGHLPRPGIKPASLMSPALADGFFTTGATWESLTKKRMHPNLVELIWGA